MSKWHVEELCAVYKGIIADAIYTFPTLRSEFERDLTRLLRLALERGIHLFVVDLPALGKHFDRCLSVGEYSRSNLPLSKGVSELVVIPKFLRGLYLLIFSQSGVLKEEINVEAVTFMRQLLYVAKKADLACSREAVVNEVNEFYATDCCLPEPEGFWTDDKLTDSIGSAEYFGFNTSSTLADRASSCGFNPAELSSLLTTLDKVSGIVCSTLGPYDPEEWRFKHGPGAISEVTGPTNKYSWRNWSPALEHVFPIADYGFHNFASWAGSTNLDSITGVNPHSRLISVPKTYTKPRLIAAEPSEHQFCQQNIWHYLHSRCKESWIGDFIRFSDQSRNQDLCLRASVDGSLATIDLSSASDRVSCHVVGQLFRRNLRLLAALRATRTRFISQTQSTDVPGMIELRKFSTMGSAVTFPVESIIFMTIAVSACLHQRRLAVTIENIRRLREEVTIFGDDIIVPIDCRELVVKALEVCYFKVNHSKSFWTGKFRESCGVDAFAGVDVTPVYWHSPTTGKPESLVSKIAVINNFTMKFLLNTAHVLTSTISRTTIPDISTRSGVCGYKSFTRPPSRLATRYNADLMRTEVKAATVISPMQAKTPITDDSALLQYFTEMPSPYTMWSSGVAQRPVLKIKDRWVPESSLNY